MRSPSSTPAGIFTDSVLCFLTRPAPLQAAHGVGTTLPLPWHLRARLLDREESLLHAHLAVAAARRAADGLRAGLGAGAVARLALLQRRNADLGFGAARGFLERDLEVVAQIGAAIDVRAAAAAAEDVAEDVAERVGEAAETGARAAPPTDRRRRGRTDRRPRACSDRSGSRRLPSLP